MVHLYVQITCSLDLVDRKHSFLQLAFDPLERLSCGKRHYFGNKYAWGMSVSGFDCFVALRFNDPQYLFF